jgi:phage N-6-adenine-methyltransferase
MIAGWRNTTKRSIGTMHQIIDREAVEIGDLARKGVERIEAGRRLLAKAEIGHGNFGRWIATHKNLLGFGDSTARRLMGAAKRALTHELTAGELWGNASAGSHEWYTPAKYIEMARRVLGQIDLDPASSEIAQRTVRADRYFSERDDGLSKQWRGRIWLNPPYTHPLLGLFITKLLEEYSAKNVTEAIVLAHSNTSALWFHTAAELAVAFCFIRGRLPFTDATGQPSKGTNPWAMQFIYFGPRPETFAEVFKDIGVILGPFTTEEVKP